MELFVVKDKMHFGRGAFGIFSTYEKAQDFVDLCEQEHACMCEIKRLPVTGAYKFPDNVFAAHNYNELYDTYIFDGLYSAFLFAYDAVGDKGLILEFVIDSPETRKIVSNEYEI